MARSYAQIQVVIWRDGEFLALSATAQRMYLFLISQHDLNACGVIGLRTRRWASAARRLGPEQVAADLAELERARFIITDEDTEELLVRSFMRCNDVGRNANLRTKALRDVDATVSDRIREVLAAELARMAQGKGVREGDQEGLFKGLGQGGVGSGVTGTGTGTGTSGTCTTDNLSARTFDEFWDAYGYKTGKQDALRAWVKAIKNTPPAKIIAAAAAEGESWGGKTQYRKHPSTWLNAGCWDDDIPDERESTAFEHY